MLGVEFQLFYLFIISFLAATIFPAQSEIVLTALYSLNEHSVLLLLFFATSGNVLGSCVNWLLGCYIRRHRHNKWFPISDKSLSKATAIYQKYGVWTLLLAWVPFIGDPLTVVAGLLRANFYVFVVLVTIGKCGRYAALLYALKYMGA